MGAAPINAVAVAALADEPLDWRFKGLPAAWWGRTPADVCADGPTLADAGAVGPLCVLRAEALTHNLATMAAWCRDRGVDLAPHGKTHMAPQLLARQFNAGACAVTVATISQLRVYRAFGVRDFVLANELVDAAALQWVAAELDADPDFTLVCWVDSLDGVRQMAAQLEAAGARRPLDVCVEVGMAGGRTGCRDASAVDEVARAAADCPRPAVGRGGGIRGGDRPGRRRPRRWPASLHICRRCVRRWSDWPACSRPTASS